MESRTKTRLTLTAVALAVLAILVRVARYGTTVPVTTVLRTRPVSLPHATTEFRTAMKLISTVVARALRSAVKVKVVLLTPTASQILVAFLTLAVRLRGYNLTGTNPTLEPTCADGISNQNETDTDCGGTCGATCQDGQSCSINGDCVNDYCTSGFVCATPTCADNVKNGNETDVDCGGVCGATCTEGQSCDGDVDCVGGSCNSNYFTCGKLQW